MGTNWQTCQSGHTAAGMMIQWEPISQEKGMSNPGRHPTLASRLLVYMHHSSRVYTWTYIHTPHKHKLLKMVPLYEGTFLNWCMFYESSFQLSVFSVWSLVTVLWNTCVTYRKSIIFPSCSHHDTLRQWFSTFLILQPFHTVPCVAANTRLRSETRGHLVPGSCAQNKD